MAMNTDEKVKELKEELTRIKWNIIGLLETRQKWKRNKPEQR